MGSPREREVQFKKVVDRTGLLMEAATVKER